MNYVTLNNGVKMPSSVTAFTKHRLKKQKNACLKQLKTAIAA